MSGVPANICKMTEKILRTWQAIVWMDVPCFCRHHLWPSNEDWGYIYQKSVT